MISQKLEENSLFYFLPGALIEIDGDSQLITFMSGIAFAIFGYSQSDIDSKIHIKEIFANTAEYERALELAKTFALKSYEEHTPYAPINHQDLYDFMFKKKTGEDFYGEVQGAFVLDDHNVPTALRLYIRDLTQQRLADKRLELALLAAKKANMAKDQFIANISHEFRTPLTSIIGFTDYLKKSLGDALEPKDRKSFDSIYRNSNRLLRTVNTILNFSEMESGSRQLNPHIVYLNQFVQDLCNYLDESARKKGLKLEFITSTKDDKVWLDEYSIEQALENIIQNAIKYTEEGGITVKLKRHRKQLVLIIADTGIGISAEYFSQMFQPFSQASEGLTREYQGLGLGLALTKRYLDWNNVEIEVESKPNQGSTFTLTFPESDTD